MVDRGEGGYLHQILPMGLGPIQVLHSDYAFFVVMLYFRYCAMWIYIVKYILEKISFYELNLTSVELVSRQAMAYS